MKNVSTYVSNIKENTDFSVDNITVEHRSNNPKRDFLFVNKAQCMHIPNSPSMIINMCKKLADMVNNELTASNILVIGFAETATAIGNLVADNLNNCKMVMTTTREEIMMAKEVISFSEEHSHASSQKLLSYDFFDVSQFDYILFVEDEISTGQTILNFIEAFTNKVGSGIKYGVASVCNWQDKEAKDKFAKKGIKTFALIEGELKDKNAKMNISNYTTNPTNRMYTLNSKECNQTSLFMMERLGHKPNRDFSDFYKKVKSFAISFIGKKGKIRVVGTEEFKYLPIKLGEFLENDGFDIICQSTTRSPIDVIENGEIKVKYQVPSVYERERKNYIYNVFDDVDMTIIVSDSILSSDMKHAFCSVFDKTMFVNPINL